MKDIAEYINEAIKKINFRFDLTDSEKQEIVKYIDKQIKRGKQFVSDFYIEQFGYEDRIRDFVFDWVQDTYNIPVADGVKYTVGSDEDEQSIEEIMDWLSSEADRLVSAVAKKMNW